MDTVLEFRRDYRYDRRLTMVVMTAPRNLIFDADDTLWESNIYFVEATETFLDLMEAHQLDRTEAYRVLLEVERQTIIHAGYGTSGFIWSLSDTARRLVPSLSLEVADRVAGLGQAIMDRTEMALLPGVKMALSHLAAHNRLFVLTKGEDMEQRRKLEISCLTPYFQHVEVVREKDVETYRLLLRQLDLDPAVTWMIGNSPRSDVNPALAAGMNAILIPHPQTWEMELEELAQDAGERLIVVNSFGDLVAVFAA